MASRKSIGCAGDAAGKAADRWSKFPTRPIRAFQRPFLPVRPFAADSPTELPTNYLCPRARTLDLEPVWALLVRWKPNGWAVRAEVNDRRTYLTATAAGTPKLGSPPKYSGAARTTPPRGSLAHPAGASSRSHYGVHRQHAICLSASGFVWCVDCHQRRARSGAAGIRSILRNLGHGGLSRGDLSVHLRPDQPEPERRRGG